jgi:hypothetical protein
VTVRSEYVYIRAILLQAFDSAAWLCDTGKPYRALRSDGANDKWLETAPCGKAPVVGWVVCCEASDSGARKDQIRTNLSVRM